MGRHSKNLPESDSELHQLPYAQVRCPGDAFNIHRPFHSNRTSRRTDSELNILRSLSEKCVPNPNGIGQSDQGPYPSLSKRLLPLSPMLSCLFRSEKVIA